MKKSQPKDRKEICWYCEEKPRVKDSWFCKICIELKKRPIDRKQAENYYDKV